MRKLLAFALALGLVLSLSGTAFAEEETPAVEAPAFRTLEQIQASGSILVGVAGNAAPYGYTDEESQSRGFEVMIAQRMAEDMGVEIEYAILSENTEIPDVLDSGSLDIIIAGFAVTEQAAAMVDFALPYMERAVQLTGEETGEAVTELMFMAPAVARGNETLLSWLCDEALALGEEEFFSAAYEAAIAEFYGGEAPEELDGAILDPFAMTANSRANLRTDPGMKSDVVETVPIGTEFVVIGQVTGWVRVWRDGNALFVSDRLVTTDPVSIPVAAGPAAPQAPAAPTVTTPPATSGTGHTHDWQPVYTTVRHNTGGYYETVVIQEAWDEVVDDTVIHHDAVTEERWVDPTSWDEQVISSYKCSLCGVTQ